MNDDIRAALRLEVMDPAIMTTDREREALRWLCEMDKERVGLRKRIAELEAEKERWRGQSMNADADGSLEHERADKADARVQELEAEVKRQSSFRETRLLERDEVQERLSDALERIAELEIELEKHLKEAGHDAARETIDYEHERAEQAILRVKELEAELERADASWSAHHASSLAALQAAGICMDDIEETISGGIGRLARCHVTYNDYAPMVAKHVMDHCDHEGYKFKWRNWREYYDRVPLDQMVCMMLDEMHSAKRISDDPAEAP